MVSLTGDARWSLFFAVKRVCPGFHSVGELIKATELSTCGRKSRRCPISKEVQVTPEREEEGEGERRFICLRVICVVALTNDFRLGSSIRMVYFPSSRQGVAVGAKLSVYR